MTVTSAPRRRSASGLVMHDAPCPTSSATFRPAKSMPCLATVSTACWMYSSQALSTGTATPTSSPFGSSSAAAPPRAMNASISSSTASGSLKPWPSKILMPLYSGGLCDAEMTMPPSQCSSRVRSAMAGVGMMPAKSAVPPMDMTPAATADSSMSPDRRVSLPMRMVRPLKATAAWPSWKAIWQVNSLFATPRTPSVPKRRAISFPFSIAVETFAKTKRYLPRFTCSSCRRTAPAGRSSSVMRLFSSAANSSISMP